MFSFLFLPLVRVPEPTQTITPTITVTPTITPTVKPGSVKDGFFKSGLTPGVSFTVQSGGAWVNAFSVHTVTVIIDSHNPSNVCTVDTYLTHPVNVAINAAAINVTNADYACSAAFSDASNASGSCQMHTSFDVTSSCGNRTVNWNNTFYWNATWQHP